MDATNWTTSWTITNLKTEADRAAMIADVKAAIGRATDAMTNSPSAKVRAKAAEALDSLWAKYRCAKYRII